MPKYRIIFRSGKDITLNIPNKIQFNGNKLVDVVDRNGKKIGFLNLSDVCFIHKVYVKGGNNEKTIKNSLAEENSN